MTMGMIFMAVIMSMGMGFMAVIMVMDMVSMAVIMIMNMVFMAATGSIRIIPMMVVMGSFIFLPGLFQKLLHHGVRLLNQL